jgi:hypothetical protein
MKTVLRKTLCCKVNPHRSGHSCHRVANEKARLSATRKRILSSHNAACSAYISNKPPRLRKIKEKTENTQHIVPFSSSNDAVKERDTLNAGADALPRQNSNQNPCRLSRDGWDKCDTSRAYYNIPKIRTRVCNKVVKKTFGRHWNPSFIYIILDIETNQCSLDC